MTFDPHRPYGPLVETTCRVATWNVWGRYGDWEPRQAGIESVLRSAAADIVCLEETWAAGPARQADAIGDALGLAHRVAVTDWPQDDWHSGAAVVARWPIARHEKRALPGGGTALYAEVSGPRGPLQVFVVMLDYPLHASGPRQEQVRELCRFVGDTQDRRHLTVVCGDFNAGPDSDEVRLLTGRAAPPTPGLVFYDAWEVAGDGGPGFTWSNDNPLAAVGLLPDRRFDYVLSAWPRRGGAGHPIACRLLGAEPAGIPLSDHYGVVADLRY